MFLKGLFKNSNGFIQLLMLLAVVFFGLLFGQILTVVVLFFRSGADAESVLSLVANIMDYPEYLREVQFISQLCAFIFPSLLLAYLFSDNYREYLRTDSALNGSTIFWTILSMILVIPALNFTTCLNQEMTLPEFLKPLEDLMRNMEEQNAKVTESMLYAKNTTDFIFNILIVAVFAAIGEEFLFRGVLQSVVGKFIHNRHIVVWTVAILFSSIHFQFYGFIPRMLLGVYFGYLLYYTQNIWIPIMAHFTNNFITVVLYRIYQDDPQTMEAADSIGYGSTWWLAVVSLALFVFACSRIQKARVVETETPYANN
jgi:membrane protease YdiL (CAAX protease family)